MPRYDECLGKPGVAGRGVVTPEIAERFERSRDRCAHRDNATSSAPTCHDCLRRSGRHIAPLLMYVMVGDPIGSDRSKRIQSDMERDLRPAKTPSPELLDQFGREVHAGRRRGGRPRLSRINGLVPGSVLRDAPDIRRNWELSVGLEPLVCVSGEAKQQLTFADVIFDNRYGRTNA